MKITFQDFVSDIVHDVSQQIAKDQSISYQDAKIKFLNSRTHQLLKNHGKDYYHKNPEFFYDLYQNELKIGEPISTEELKYLETK